MPGYMDLYEESSDDDLDGLKDYMSNIHRSRKNSKSPKHHVNYLKDNVIDGASSQDKIAAKNAMKHSTLKETPRLRQNNVSEKDKENKYVTNFVTQATHLSSESQSYSTPTSQESTTAMRLMTLRLDNMLKQMENRCQEKLKLYVDKAISDAIDKIKTINDEGVNTIMSTIENMSIQEPSKRKVAKKDIDNWNTAGTWSVKIGDEKKPLCFVALDVRKVVIAIDRDHLVSIKKAPDANLRQFLDKHTDISTIAKDLSNPQKLGMTIADIMFPKDVQIFFKFYHSLTRTSKRPPLPEDKMKTFRQALLYCGMASFCVKEERQQYFSTVVEAINNRASHWSGRGQKASFNSDDFETFWKSSDFPWPVDVKIENANV
uniref:DUF4806 domain-containing protein n=1 Tax=Strongyloides papillosus TaxID=174720 RepID=A0A0N5CCW9_STREA